MPSDAWLKDEVAYVVFSALDAEVIFALTGDPPQLIAAKLVPLNVDCEGAVVDLGVAPVSGSGP